MTSIKKLRFSSRRRTKVRHQGPRDSTRAQPWTNIFRVWARPCYCTNPTITFKMSHQKTIKGSFCPLQHLEKDPKKNYKFSVQWIEHNKQSTNCEKQNLPNVGNCSQLIIKVSTESARVLKNDTEITSTDGQGDHVGGVLVVNTIEFFLKEFT